MSYGAVALKDAVVPIAALGSELTPSALKDVGVPLVARSGGLPAPAILSIVIEPNGDFELQARLPRNDSVVGAMLAWVKKDHPTHYPLDELSMPQVLAVQDVLSLPMGGPPGATLPFTGNVGSLIQGGDGVEFACAASDDPDDLETP